MFGLCVALARTAQNPLGRRVTAGYIAVFQGTPLLMQLFVVYYGVGMPAHPGMPVRAELIDVRHWVADIVYMPLVTTLLETASQKGCRILQGGGMAVFQAVDAFRLFSGKKPDPERMSAHFAELCLNESVA